MAASKLTIKTNGSIKVEGDFEIVDENGDIYNPETKTFSRPTE